MRPETKAMQTLIDQIETRLTTASRHNTRAALTIKDGLVKDAIGSLLPIEQDLELALTLYRAVIALHRAPKQRS